MTPAPPITDKRVVVQHNEVKSLPRYILRLQPDDQFFDRLDREYDDEEDAPKQPTVKSLGGSGLYNSYQPYNKKYFYTSPKPVYRPPTPTNPSYISVTISL